MRILPFGLTVFLLTLVPAFAQGDVAGDPITDTLGTLFVGPPVAYGSLTLFPLDHPFATDPSHYWTVEELLANGSLRLTETAPQRQNVLLLQAAAGRDQFGGALGGWGLDGGGGNWGNTGGKDQLGGNVFGQAGGGLGGGGQNRGFVRSFLLPGNGPRGNNPNPFLPEGPRLAQGFPPLPEEDGARITTPTAGMGETKKKPVSLSAAEVDQALRTTGLPVPVVCLEEKRFAGSSPGFKPTFTLAPNSVRRAMLGELTPETQKTVWQKVDEELRLAGNPSPTRALEALYHPPQFRAAVEEVLADLSQQPVWNDHTVGLAAAVHGRLVAVDVYANPDLFRRLAPRLIAAHAVEATRGTPAPPPAPEAVYAFLKALAYAPRKVQPAYALGQDYLLRSPVVVGEALVHQGKLIHAAGFPLTGN